MKKAIVLLLALTVLGGAVFAQVAVGLSASGGVTLFDQDGNAGFNRDGAAYDLLTLKASADQTSVAVTLDNFDSFANGTGGNLLFRDWYFASANDMVKVILGKPRNGDFRYAPANGWFMEVGSTYRFFDGPAYGAIVESTGLGDLTLGLGLGIPEAGVDALNMLKTTNLAAKYTIADVGTIQALAMLDLLDTTASVQKIGASFQYTGMENLDAALFTRIVLGDENQFYVGANAYYTMDAIFFGLEAEYLSNYNTGTAALPVYTDAPSIGAKVGYTLNDAISAFVKGGYLIDETYEVWAGVDYDFIPGLTAELEAGYAEEEVKYDLSVYYEYSF